MTTQTTNLAALKVGEVYRIRWPGHYNQHQRDVGYTARFLRIMPRHCSMHGEFLGMEAEFVKVKPSGRDSYRFTAGPNDISVTQEKPE